MELHLRGLPEAIGQTPRAVVVISAHWEEERITIQTSPKPGMLFDYHGFPDYTYRLSYPAPGAPDLAKDIHTLLTDQGIDAGLDNERGFDHGTFIPFMLIYPHAHIPIVQVSLRRDLDPSFHIRLGQALAPLAERGVLLTGSGMSYHNLRAFLAVAPEHHLSEARAFDDWLNETVGLDDTEERNRRLIRWRDAPGARAAHPREDHLMPLLVIAGAALKKTGRRIFADAIMDKPVSSFLFD